MVATRKSGSRALSDHEGDDEDVVEQDEEAETVAGAEMENDHRRSRRVENALRKLEIDGTAALAGNRVNRRQTTGTYHYRGAVYDITADTPQAWIDQQPPRYRRSESEATRPISSRDDKVIGKRKLDDVETDDVEEDSTGRTPLMKKARLSAPERAGGRRMSNMGYNTRSSTALDRNVEDRQRQILRRKRGTGQLTAHGYSDLMAKISSAQEVAREKGYEMVPLAMSEGAVEKAELDKALVRDFKKLFRLVNPRYKMLKKVYKSMKARGEFGADLKFTRSTDETSRASEDMRAAEEEEQEHGGDDEDEDEDRMLEMPKPADIALATDYDSPASASAQLQDLEVPESPSADDAYSSPLHRPNTDSISPETNSASPKREGSDIAMSIEQGREPELQLNSIPHLVSPKKIGCKPTLSSDVSTPVCAPLKLSNPPKQTSDLPSGTTSSSQPSRKKLDRHIARCSPQLSDKLHDDERAESAILTRLRKSESARAYCRRVKREKALMRSWPAADK